MGHDLQATGADGLLNMGSSKRSYDYGAKICVSSSRFEQNGQ